MAISRSQMRQQVSKPPQKKKLNKKKRVRIVMGTKNKKAKKKMSA